MYIYVQSIFLTNITTHFKADLKDFTTKPLLFVYYESQISIRKNKHSYINLFFFKNVLTYKKEYNKNAPTYKKYNVTK